ncbi:MAG: phosphodiester glycosidase family protein [Clostridia bacterium]
MKKKIIKIIAILLVFEALYLFVVFTNMPFIAKWRTIYIETAMSTMTKRWMATAFFPKKIIDAVMSNVDNTEGYDTNLATIKRENAPRISSIKNKNTFYKVFNEIDPKSLEAFLAANPTLLANGYEKLYLNTLDKKYKGNIKINNIFGSEICLLDAYNGILVSKVSGDGFAGQLMTIKDPAQIKVGLSSKFGNSGEYLKDIIDFNSAIAGINGSGFYDPNGKGNGGTAFGLIISEGKKVNPPLGKKNKIIGFDKEDNFFVGNYKNTDFMRDVVEFRPALIVNGKKVVAGSSGWGIQPRSCLAQRADGAVLMLIIDGRQIGYSIGATVGDCADILEKYGAINAANLDGGTSAVMVYNGKELTKPSNGNPPGRFLPNGFIIMPRK